MNKSCLKNNFILAFCNPDCIGFLLVWHVNWNGFGL